MRDERRPAGHAPYALAHLPRVYATASVERATDALRINVQQRKRPHCFRLVKAAPAPLGMPKTERPEDRELVFYREYTEAMLRRYLTISMEVGRVPSMLGRELFRGNVSSYNNVQAFDDAVIFVIDVEKCLQALAPGLRHLIRRIAIEGYTQQEAAALSGISLRTVTRRYPEGIDKLTRLFLDGKILEAVFPR